MSSSTQANIYTIDTVNYDTEKIRTKIFTNKDGNLTYKVLNNSLQDESSRNYRSIICDDSGKILCFSPPNSLANDEFKEKYPDIDTDDFLVNQIVEGTMINLFYDDRGLDNSKWSLSTRSGVGANYWYYRTQYITNTEEPELLTPQKTFRKMFDDAFNWNFINKFPTNYCYSFVLQHPDNHIVLPILKPALYLVAVYEIKKDTNSVVYISPTEYESWDFLKTCTFINLQNAGLETPAFVPDFPYGKSGEGIPLKNTVCGPRATDGVLEVKFPQKYNQQTYDELKQEFSSVQTSFSVLGAMLTNIKTGERTSFINPVYEEVRAMRGNNPNLQYQYFCIKSIDQRNRFLGFFPKYKKLFFQFNKQYQEFITNVHQSYFSFYVKKENITISKKFFIHASKIHHQIYLPSLENGGGNKKIITRSVVRDYFDAMTPSELLYYFHYDKRQASFLLKKKQHEHTSCEDGDIPDISIDDEIHGNANILDEIENNQ